MGTTAVTITDGVKVSASDAVVKRRVETLRDLVVVAPSALRTWKLPVTVRDTARVGFKGSAAAVHAVVVRSGMAVSTAIRSTMPVTLRSAVRLRASSAVKLGVVLREKIAVSGLASGPTAYARTLTSRVRIRDHLPGAKLGGFLSDVVTYAAHTLGLRRVIAQAHETVTVSDEILAQLQIILLVSDAIEVGDEQILRSVYNGYLSDRMDFILDVIDPGGDTTTWAMNVRTGAITEYLGFAFNSFAKSANGTHLAAGPDGLYELAGPDDDGTPIPATLTGGLVDFSGPYLSSLQAVYLGLRGNGDFFLKLTQGDGGRSVVYRVGVSSLRTARVTVGKGWRARYFTWELVSPGQDFDLLDIDFLPIQQNRRI